MEKQKDYPGTRFSARLVRSALEVVNKKLDAPYRRISCRVTGGDETWSFDHADEFFSMYGQEQVRSANMTCYWSQPAPAIGDIELGLYYSSRVSVVSVSASDRALIQAVFSIFEEATGDDKILFEHSPEDLSPVVFIGHGGSDQWERLKSHLQDKHEVKVVSYETGARAGHTIRDILDGMIEECSFALLVLTGEDQTESGLRARQNVIHECGLFQGQLGFDRAIMLVEKGVELASNFDGIHQLRFERGRISEIFGDVVATLRREFGPL